MPLPIVMGQITCCTTCQDLFAGRPGVLYYTIVGFDCPTNSEEFNELLTFAAHDANSTDCAKVTQASPEFAVRTYTFYLSVFHAYPIAFACSRSLFRLFLSACFRQKA